MSSHHLAQLNVGRLLAPVDDPKLAEFKAGLDPINAVADTAPGFVWRLQDDDGNATSFRPYDDDQVAVNFSVWESIEHLRAFVYTTDHKAYLARRKEWFEMPDQPITVLWWTPAGTIPTLQEAVERLEHLRAHGPTPHAFTLREAFPA